LDVFDSDGRPRQRRGVVEVSPGLYFLGNEFLYAAASETLPGICRDAAYLARQIEARSTPGTIALRHSDVLQTEVA
jgi:putative flavoprotein involved in K+ transport